MNKDQTMLIGVILGMVLGASTVLAFLVTSGWGIVTAIAMIVILITACTRN